MWLLENLNSIKPRGIFKNIYLSQNGSGSGSMKGPGGGGKKLANS